MQDADLVSITADIVAAHVSNNSVAVSEIGALVESVHQALKGLGNPVEELPTPKNPVVSARASIKPDYIVCLECGKKQKTIKRHLKTAHGLTPEQYRQDYGLPSTYPMTAPAYSKRRSEMARAIGLGRGGHKLTRAKSGTAAQIKAGTKRRKRKPV